MTLLNRFLKLLEWLEAGQDVIAFLTDSMGLSAVLALCLYFPIQSLGCDAVSAATLSCTAALTLFCLLEKPEFH
ncbi:MAG: hypothetical protein AAFU71_06910 [Cyanobacteria bacterium J06632_22]